MPDALKNEPFISEADVFYISAFGDLNTCRQYTFAGATNIPWTAVSQYAERHGVIDFDLFWACIKALDSVFLEHISKKVGDGR